MQSTQSLHAHHESDDYCCRLPRRDGTFNSPLPLPQFCPRSSASRDRRRVRGRRGTCDRSRGPRRLADGSSPRIRGSGLAKRRVFPFRRLLLVELEAMRQR
ncbi:hypothetical protein ALC62_01744 [Cyphomyrmex costatus]|uniref:Uncharacterized protein n=1 Tax=Cyphomyrmex costatus TaxID=456900 RepID=A0A195D3S2_9HYME|nr:hypothetical protein ALC62_01744 [Cyphomyrmex costatus]